MNRLDIDCHSSRVHCFSYLPVMQESGILPLYLVLCAVPVVIEEIGQVYFARLPTIVRSKPLRYLPSEVGSGKKDTFGSISFRDYR